MLSDTEKKKGAVKRQLVYVEKHRDDPVFLQKLKSRKAALYAIRTGRLVRGPCVSCQRLPEVVNGRNVVQAHHANGYDNEHALDVEWMCTKCHGDAHRKYPKKEKGKVHLDGSHDLACGNGWLGGRTSKKESEITCAICLGRMARSKVDTPVVIRPVKRIYIDKALQVPLGIAVNSEGTTPELYVHQAIHEKMARNVNADYTDYTGAKGLKEIAP